MCLAAKIIRPGLADEWCVFRFDPNGPRNQPMPPALAEVWDQAEVWAWNASFEQNITRRVLGWPEPGGPGDAGWHCRLPQPPPEPPGRGQVLWARGQARGRPQDHAQDLPAPQENRSVPSPRPRRNGSSSWPIAGMTWRWRRPLGLACRSSRSGDRGVAGGQCHQPARDAD
jgi:hypothetical protein